MRYINKTYKYIVLFLFILAMGTSCEKDFTEMNVHPMKPTETSLNFIFTGLESKTRWPGDFQLYGQNERMYQWSQLGAYAGGGDPSTGDDNPNNMNDRGRNALWGPYYQFLANYQVMLQKAADDVDPDRLVIRMEIAKILHAYMSLKTSDIYGDIPYFDAGKGSSDLIYRPAFDGQDLVYKDAITNLDDAVTVLSGVTIGDVTPGGSIIKGYGTADVIYGGDVSKWIKFANTIRLRYALRMSNADNGFATPHIEDAINGPLMESYEDGLNFENANRYYAYQYGMNIRLSSTAWPYMNADDDPAVDGSDIIDPRVYIWYETNEDNEWVACPISWDFDSRPNSITGYPYDPNRRNDNDDSESLYRGNYSAINWYVAENRITNIEFQVPYSESCFLRAEAILKGHGSGDAKDWYEKGIEASILKFYKLNNHEDWTAAPEVPTAEEIAAFIAHPRIAYNSATGLKQVVIQRWLDCMFNPGQAWCLVRRTGLIPLDVVKDRVTNAPVPMATRFQYPETENTQNEENFDAQMAKMGGNTFTATIWWDVNN